MYVAAAVACVVLFGLTLAFLAVMGALGVLSVLAFGDANTLVVTAFGAFGLLVSGAIGFVVVEGARRADRWLVEAARRPEPFEDVTTRYVAGDIDERGLERGLERVFAGSRDERTVADEELSVTVHRGDDARDTRESEER